MDPEPVSQVFANVAGETVTWGCPIIDMVFGGGVPVGSITEIVSKSGVGKTQLCLQLALNAQIPRHKGGLEGTSVYLYSEGPFPVRRLHQLTSTMGDLRPNAMDYVFVHEVQTVDDVLAILRRLDNARPTRDVRLLVIDSVASLFRGRFKNTGAEMSRRQKKFFELSSKLKSCAHKHSMALVVTNQVVDAFESSTTFRVGNEPSLDTSGRLIYPALGLSWSSCVNTRIALVSREDTIQDNESNIQCLERRRTMKVIFAPYLGNVECDFVISKEGFWGV